jgi:hypothetical protein
VKDRARAALLGGALVELATGPGHRRVVDVAASAAGASGPPSRLRAGSGGSLLVDLRRIGGEPMFLRAAGAGTPADPVRHAEALLALADAHIVIVPRLLGAGVVAGASWSAETALPGRRTRRAVADVAAQVAGLCMALPRRDEPPTAWVQDVAAIAGRFPEHAGVIRGLSDDLGSALASIPAVARHGDLWAGNLLVSGRTLTAVLDWDGWDPGGVPGADLLHLVATEEAHRTRRSLGSVCLERPWASELYRRLTSEYWRSLRIKPTRAQLEAIGIAWWACSVATTLRRLPDLAEDQAWTMANVHAVIAGHAA